MAEITVVLGSKKLKTVRLVKDHMIFIGRNPESDIHLDNPLVSRKHAMIYQRNAIWFIKDLSGKNGLFINGEPIEKSPLHNGYVIGVAKYMLTFKQSRDELERDRAIDQNKPGGQFKTSFEDALSDAVEASRKAKPSASQPVVIDETMTMGKTQLNALRAEMGKRLKPHFQALTEMDRRTYSIDKQTTRLGRAADVDIRLKGGFMLGKEHATVTRRGSDFVLVQVGGMGGVKVNGEKLPKGTEYLLEDEDTIEIGSNRMKFVAGLKRK